MNALKVLELINNNKLEEIATMAKEEIYYNSAGTKATAKQKIAAVKKISKEWNKTHAGAGVGFEGGKTYCSDGCVAYSLIGELPLTSSTDFIEGWGSKISDLIGGVKPTNTTDSNIDFIHELQAWYKIQKLEIKNDCLILVKIDESYFQAAYLIECFKIMRDDFTMETSTIMGAMRVKNKKGDAGIILPIRTPENGSKHVTFQH